MTNTKTLKKGLLAATSAAALMFGATAAQADSIGFAPGAAVGGVQANAHGSTDLETKNQVDVFNWSSLNDTFVATGATAAAVSTAANNAGLNATQAAQSWFVNITDNGAAGASTDDTFTESFSFSLISTTADDGGVGSDAYGNINTFNSHVTMQLTASGNIANISGDPTYDQDTSFSLDYTSAVFTMSFDSNGDNDDDTDNIDTIIATFSGDGESTVFAADANGVIRGDLAWNADWLTALEGVFDVPFGGDDATDGPGLEALRSGLDAFKLTQQDVIRNHNGGSQYLLTSDDLATGSSQIFVRTPEPGTLALFGAGLLGLGAMSRRRRKSA